MPTRKNRLYRIKERRNDVIDRLTAQLARGKKGPRDSEIDLTKEDRARIERELETLKKRA